MRLVRKNVEGAFIQELKAKIRICRETPTGKPPCRAIQVNASSLRGITTTQDGYTYQEDITCEEALAGDLETDNNFWQNSQFVRWRLMRHNCRYQTAVWDYYETQLTSPLSSNPERVMPFLADFHPEAGESFDQWARRLAQPSLLFAGAALSSCGLLGLTFGPGGLLPPALPYVRYPLPILLSHLPPPAPLRGPMRNWRRAILTYDAAMGEVRDSEIARFLYGLSSREQEKTNQERQVSRTLAIVDALVRNAFPFPS